MIFLLGSSGRQGFELPPHQALGLLAFCAATAAVHAGLITLADGGQVTFRLTPGEESYTGSTANGVQSRDYGSWGASFQFVGE